MEDPFNSLNGSTWITSGHQILDGGAIKNTGTESWNVNFYRTTYNLNGGAQGQGIKVEFKVNGTDTWAHFSLETNTPYYRVGVVARGNRISVQYNTGSGSIYP